jgi:hypothetical protein
MPWKKKRKGYIAPGRRRAYEKLKAKTGSKKIAAMIANRGRTFAGRSAMARKAARTRRRR